MKILEQAVNEFISIHEYVRSLRLWLRAANRFILGEATRKLVCDVTVTCYAHKPEVILGCHKQELIFGNLIANSGTEAQGHSLLLHQTVLLKSLT